MVRAFPWVLTCAVLAIGCTKDVGGPRVGPGLGTGASTTGADTADVDDPTTSISASAGESSGQPDDDDGDGATSGDSDPTGASTASTTGDGGSTGAVDPTDGSASSDGSTGGGGSSDTAATTDPTTGGGSTLDPLLDIAESGELCTTPGHLGECSGVATVCRFHDTNSGRCETCEECGNLNAFCNDGTECDILFSCFANRCTNFCTLGTYECGPIEDCLDVGHPTIGVCDPYAL